MIISERILIIQLIFTFFTLKAEVIRCDEILDGHLTMREVSQIYGLYAKVIMQVSNTVQLLRTTKLQGVQPGFSISPVYYRIIGFNQVTRWNFRVYADKVQIIRPVYTKMLAPSPPQGHPAAELNIAISQIKGLQLLIKKCMKSSLSLGMEGNPPTAGQHFFIHTGS